MPARGVAWLIATGFLLLVVFFPSSPRAVAESSPLPPSQGQTLFQTNCSTCHGLGAQGTADGPSLQGVGSAAVNFMLTSGRMPLANPGDQPNRAPTRFTAAQIQAIVGYVATIAPGGPAIPTVDTSKGNLSAGQQLFLDNCASCHGAGASGDSVGGGQIAPPLAPPTPTQIGEAVRIGPGVMPRFNQSNLSDADVDSIARYLVWLRQRNLSRHGGLQLGRIGPVSEGLVALVIGLGLAVFATRLVGTKS